MMSTLNMFSSSLLMIALFLVDSTRGFVTHHSNPSLAAGRVDSALHARPPPSLIVFDLDNTLWTPELYQLRRKTNKRRVSDSQTPIADKDVKLFDGAKKVLQRLQEQPSDVKLAIASRTKSGEWAKSLLDQFGLTDSFCDIQIFSGDKTTHFQNLHRNTGIPYEEMLFFDDARDGKFGNCVPVSELGVLCCHCPGGIDTEQVFDTAMSKFQQEWDGSSHTILEWDGTMTKTVTDQGGRQSATVKVVFPEKLYGFLKFSDSSRRGDVFFHCSDLTSNNMDVQVGDEVTFVMGTHRGKPCAKQVEITTAVGGSDDEVTMRAFSMNLPFSALLANGYKDLETRNGTMFVPYEAGTKFLLHVGQRTYPDGNRHLEIMKSGGLDDAAIEELKSLPSGFGKGMAVAIVEIGDTYETTVEERSDPEMQRRIGAYGTDSGMRCTEIRRVEYLKQPIRAKARGGVFKLNVDRGVIPEGWIIE